MPKLGAQLDLPRCPHCNVDRPSLVLVHAVETNTYDNSNLRRWRIYRCTRCGGLITAAAKAYDAEVREAFPAPLEVEATLPTRAREYLEQALNSLHAAAGAVMLAASAVDSMLKEKGYKEGSLYSRIDQAAAEGVITKDMALWAHDVRLELVLRKIC